MSRADRLRRLFLFDPRPAPRVVDPGLFHYFREAEDTYTRFHLRVDNDGFGMLLANATAAARLSPTGVVIAKSLLESESEETIMNNLTAAFSGTTQTQMKKDLDMVAGIISDLSLPGDNYPIINLEDADLSPNESELIAPLRADLSIGKFETTQEILNRLWSAAIPHVTFRGLDDVQSDGLIHAIEHAEDLGMITGARAQARQLNFEGAVYRLAQAGIDYITVPVASSHPATHDSLFGNDDSSHLASALKQLLANEVPPVAEIPLMNLTLSELQQTLEYLQSMGVHNVQFYAISAPDEMNPQDTAGALTSSSMPQAADMVEEISDEMDVRFIWQPPVLRLPELSLSHQVQMGPRCSDDFSVRVDSLGEVFPARGPYQSTGNLLNREWTDIWNHSTFIKYRQRVESPTRCDDCPDLAICAADCPRKLQGWSQGYGPISEKQDDN